MSPHLTRALLLLRQSRPDLAERELRQALLADPNDTQAHGFLSLCLAEQRKLEPATEEARAAIAAAPDLPLGHYALAVALRRRNRYDAAREAIREALRLDPGDADHWGELAQIELNRRDWAAALEAAERGLAIEPEDVACNNLRAVALVKLGRREEAGATIDAALARDPDDPVTHANQGWTLLHAGEPRKAMEHFRESLRLDPSSEWARAGIVEAMKARNPLYRWLLAYFLWAARLDRRVLWGLIVGLWFGSRVLLTIGDAVPAARPIILPVLVAYFVLCLTTWIGRPLADLLLRLDRFGRHALSPEQVKSSNLVGLTVLIALGFLAAALIAGDDVRTFFLFDALWIGLLTIPVSMIYNCPAGWPRLAAAGIAAALALWAGIAVVGTVMIATDTMPVPVFLAFRPVLHSMRDYYAWGILAASLAGNALAGAVVRR
jgi:Tfp pilus assembly protein PilF